MGDTLNEQYRIVNFNEEIILKNIENSLNNLSQFTSTPNNGVTRLPFTDEAKKAVEYLKNAMDNIGLKTRIDESGAIIGRLEGKKKETIIVGSHYDSVVYGGAFDGIAGVICGLEVARIFIENNITPKYSLEIIGTNDEEGARFSSGFFSSKAMIGELKIEELKKLKDSDNISIYEAMKSYGLNPENIYNAKRNLKEIKGFIEIHIEQGPVLENHNKNIGIVDTIVGMKRGIVTIKGREDHAGTTPMNMRIDGVEIATKAISKVGDIARKYKNAVATVGYINVIPNAINTIAKEIKFSLDIRSTSDVIVKKIFEEIMDNINIITTEFNTTYDFESTLYVEPIDMSINLRGEIEESCIERGFGYEHINSGAGHDSLPIGKNIDTAMIFVPSKGGRSHCIEEFTDYKCLKEATIVAFDIINKIN